MDLRKNGGLPSATPNSVPLPEFPDPVEVYERLEARVREERPWEDLAALRKAFFYAHDHHKLQKRESGEPYILHPLGVTEILVDGKLHVRVAIFEEGIHHPQAFARRYGAVPAAVEYPDRPLGFRQLLHCLRVAATTNGGDRRQILSVLCGKSKSAESSHAQPG